MTPSPTPGSPSSDDPMPWSEHDPHDPDDATRPMPPVTGIRDGWPSEDTAPVPRERLGPTAQGGARAHDSGRPTPQDSPDDWSWYDDDAQHTRPIPSVTAQRPNPDEPGAPGPGQEPAAGYGPGRAPGYGTAAGPGADPAVRLARQREEFGGLQLVPGFYGWLSALALTWLLLALAGLVASALGFRLPDGMGAVADEIASGSVSTWTAVAALGVVEFLAFLGGGYTAGRMARFSGAAQGFAVWLWSLFGRSVATVTGLVWADTIGLAPVGVSAQSLIGELLVPGLLAVAAVLVVDLVAAVLGGLWGLRYHRRVDRWAGPQQ